MKKNIKISIWPALLEMGVLMAILAAGLELLKRSGGLKLENTEWQIITILYAAFVPVVILYFLLKKHITHNKQLELEIAWLKKEEAELKSKVNELSHFKDLIVWWEKKIIDIEDDVKKIKERMGDN